MELGARAQYDEKTQVAIVNGSHDNKTIADLLDKYIDKYVLCPGCGLPETDLFLRKGTIIAVCKACPYIGPVDMNHKLGPYMLRDPPPVYEDSQKQKPKAQKATKKTEEKEDIVPLPKSDEKVEWFSDTSKEAAAQRRADELGRLTAELTQDSEEGISLFQ